MNLRIGSRVKGLVRWHSEEGEASLAASSAVNIWALDTLLKEEHQGEVDVVEGNKEKPGMGTWPPKVVEALDRLHDYQPTASETTYYEDQQDHLLNIESIRVHAVTCLIGSKGER